MPRAFIAALIRRNLALFILVTVHYVAALLAGALLGLPLERSLLSFLGGMFVLVLPFYLMAVVSWRLIILAFIERPVSPSRALGSWILAKVSDKERMVDGIAALLLISTLIVSFSYFKTVMTAINPFSWDPAFAAMDRALHFGRDPYELLLPLLGSPLMTTMINAAYHAWMFLMYFVVLIACFTRYDLRSRMIFLLAFALTWSIGGNLLATLFSSAGPVYYERLGYGDDFVPLMQLLYSVAEVSPVWALDVHERLWSGYIGNDMNAGISAMPSMHLASTTLLALYAGTYARWLGVLMWLFVVVILLGSVHLAWHYAIDSYAGILIAVVMWYVAGWIVTRVDNDRQESGAK
jgi:hypothetical protein